MKITLEQFIKMFDGELIKHCGMGHADLPDLIMIDDYFNEGMNINEARQAAVDAATELLAEIGY